MTGDGAALAEGGRKMRAFAVTLFALCLSAGAAMAQTSHVPTPTPRPSPPPQTNDAPPDPSALLQRAIPLMPQADKEIIWAVGEVAGELQLCAVYFGFVAYCLDQNPGGQTKDLAKPYHAAADRLNELALKSHMAAGLSADAYIAMLPLHMQNMRALLGNRDSAQCSNIAVLLNKYMNFCQRLSQDADPRVMEWIACIRANQQTCGGP